MILIQTQRGEGVSSILVTCSLKMIPIRKKKQVVIGCRNRKIVNNHCWPIFTAGETVCYAV